MNDRYKLSQFYNNNTPRLPFLSLSDSKIKQLPGFYINLDLPDGFPKKQKDIAEGRWAETLPELENLKALGVNHRIGQEFFDAICQTPNLEHLFLFGSSAENISSISKLQKLQKLYLHSFTRLTDISPLATLKNLSVLSIENCFKVENYEILSQLPGLVGLELCGDAFAPKHLILKSLKPFVTLKNLKHLAISTVSVADKSYECFLEMEGLERLDFLRRMPKSTRENIKSHHKNLKAGFFVDFDFEN
ncbi:MAG: hypothetical protein JST32_08415, partial [Bacteroidetes bacterium]|nr:hypothetical protein [Bacteroidota bacterium]